MACDVKRTAAICDVEGFVVICGCFFGHPLDAFFYTSLLFDL